MITSTRNLSLVVVVAALALALAACGGGGDGSVTEGDGMMSGDGDGMTSGEDDGDGMLDLGQWNPVTLGVVEVGFSNTTLGLNAQYDLTGTYPTITASSPMHQPTVSGSWGIM